MNGNPLESPGSDETQNQEIISAKAGRVFPDFIVQVGALKRNVEHRTFVGLLTPNARTDESVADFVSGLVFGFVG